MWASPKPVVHTQSRAFGTDSTSTDLTSQYQLSDKGFQNSRAFGSDSTSTDLQESGYDYLVGSTTVEINIEFNEPIFLTDTVASLSPDHDEPAFLLDELTTEINTYFDELLFLTDSETAEALTPEPTFLLDELETELNIYFDEFLFLSETAAPYQDDTLDFTVVLQVLQNETKDSTTVIKVTEEIDASDTTVLNIYPNNLVAVTNASSVNNIFNPVVILNGQYVINPQSQVITDASLANCYVQYDCNAITGGLSNVLNWSVNINNEGGSFSVTTITQIASRGDTISVFGLTGFVTSDGEDVSNSSYGYTINGILGTPTLHKQLAFTLGGNVNYIDLIPNQYLVTPDLSAWQTCSDAARAIADVCDIEILWAVNDAPLDDLFNETSSGMTGLQALSSIASRVGANLRWNGGTSYIVAYPDTTFGLFTILDCCLIEGLNYQNIYDLETGAGLGNLNAGSLGPGSAGVVLFPQLRNFNSGTKDLGDGLINPDLNPSVHQFDKIRIRVQDEDPVITYDLPFNYQDVYIQILTKTNGIGRYVTTDPSEWFLLNTPGAVGYSNVGSNLIPQIFVSPNLFPAEGTNIEVDNGNFVMTLAATLRTLGGAYDTERNKRDSDIMNLLRQTQESFRFIRTYAGTINGIFFGALPLTGLAAEASVTATVLGETRTTEVTGIIESVSFSSPGVLSISVAQYVRMNFLQELKTFHN